MRTTYRRVTAVEASGGAVDIDRLVVGGGELVGHTVAQAGLLAHPVRDLDHHLGIGGQIGLGVLTPLTELLTVVGEPGPGLLDDGHVDGHVEQRALTADALAVHDVEFGLTERWRHLVLHDLDAGAVSDDLRTILDGFDAADVETDR